MARHFKAGLSRFNPNIGAIRNFDVADGLPGNHFTNQASCRSRSLVDVYEEAAAGAGQWPVHSRLHPMPLCQPVAARPLTV